MQEQITLEIEELEERIAPATLSVAIPANAASAGHAPSSVPAGGATVNAAAAAATASGVVSVS